MRPAIMRARGGGKRETGGPPGEDNYTGVAILRIRRNAPFTIRG